MVRIFFFYPEKNSDKKKKLSYPDFKTAQSLRKEIKEQIKPWFLHMSVKLSTLSDTCHVSTPFGI